MLEGLVGGRVAVASMALQLSKLGLAIATTYASQRRQFGPTRDTEVPILDYLATQRRLLPFIAVTYALQFGMNYAKQRFEKRSQTDRRDVFLLAAGFKAVCTWHRSQTLQLCREVMGGQGFNLLSRIGMMRADSDIDVTFEGDNTVLLQAVAKALLDEYKSHFKINRKRITGLLTYMSGQFGVIVRNKNILVRRLTSEVRTLIVSSIARVAQAS